MEYLLRRLIHRFAARVPLLLVVLDSPRVELASFFDLADLLAASCELLL
jgi:hypothetical protein